MSKGIGNVLLVYQYYCNTPFFTDIRVHFFDNYIFIKFKGVWGIFSKIPYGFSNKISESSIKASQSGFLVSFQRLSQSVDIAWFQSKFSKKRIKQRSLRPVAESAVYHLVSKRTSACVSIVSA